MMLALPLGISNFGIVGAALAIFLVRAITYQLTVARFTALTKLSWIETLCLNWQFVRDAVPSMAKLSSNRSRSDGTH